MAVTSSTIVSDLIEGARWQEKDGLLTSIERVFIVKVFGTTPPVPGGGAGPGGVPGFPQDDEVFKLALAATDLPFAGQAHPIHDNLLVRARTPMALGPVTVKVTIQYSLPDGGAFEPPFGSQYMMSGGSSVEQIETQMAVQPPGSGAATQITVEHEGVVQGGEITPTEGRAVMRFGSSIPHLSPWNMANFWVNKVNSGPFQPYSNEAARKWLITEMNYELAQRTTASGFPIYEFSMVMSHNPDTWDPVVVFVDEKTGRPPAGLVTSGVNAGIKKIAWHAEANFSQLFT